MSVTNFKNPETVGEGGQQIVDGTKQLNEKLIELEATIKQLRDSGVANAPGLNAKLTATEADINKIKSSESLSMIASYGKVAIERANAHIEYENKSSQMFN